MAQKNVWVKCPTCRRANEWSADNPFRPFCSERCRLIDLGAWVNEDYTVETGEEEWLSGAELNHRH
ncbi:DNA gyrase inhibitor YacG [Neisseria musculi]|uniref:DNA gyrase inhibitor YacG n=1 Tax=Neisseria musculi TaxID=1815583 RepID=UPI00164BFAD2|nr:DNA gyrase inhibitor YacG [Neisseria musculi]